MQQATVDDLPDELKTSRRFVLWRYEDVKGRRTKVPYSATTSGKAAVNRPETWADFRTARSCLRDEKGVDGIGIVFGNGLVGIDLDKCANGTLEPWARQIATQMKSYTEWSPSRSGVHILLYGDLSHGRRNGKIEVYGALRYFTLTGHHVAGTPKQVLPRQRELDAFLAEQVPNRVTYVTRRHADPVGTDRDVIDRLGAAPGLRGEKFNRLWAGNISDYPSRSEADLALASMLAFAVRGDAHTADRLFRQSGLMRAKWDRWGYGERTIARACR